MPCQFRPDLKVWGLGLLLLCGCGSGDGPPLVAAGGVIQFQGQPLADAQVSFVPESGPVATAITNAEGNFTLNTRGKPGVVQGNHRIAIIAYEQTNSPAGSQDDNSNIPPAVSRIPEKYGLIKRSGLTATVSPKAEENQFRLELQ